MKRKKKVAQQPVVEEVAPAPAVEAVPVKEPKTWIVNCPKCGASLSMKEGGCAYMCPVCKTLLRVKTSARLVKNLDEGNKKLHVTLTENAVKYLTEKNNPENANAPVQSVQPTQPEQPDLGKLLAQNVADGFSDGDSIVVDVSDNGLSVTKA